MKWFLSILLLLTTMPLCAQKKDSVTCLPNKDILRVANGIQLLRDTINIQRTTITNLELTLDWSNNIRTKQDGLLNNYEIRVINYQDQLNTKIGESRTLQRENEELHKIIDHLMPKWYDNKWLWFGGGIAVTTIIIGVLK